MTKRKASTANRAEISQSDWFGSVSDFVFESADDDFVFAGFPDGEVSVEAEEDVNAVSDDVDVDPAASLTAPAVAASA